MGSLRGATHPVLTGDWQPSLFVIASALSPGKSTFLSLATSMLGLSMQCQKERTECSGRQTCRISSLLPFMMLCQLPRTAPSNQFIFLDIILEKTWEEENLSWRFFLMEWTNFWISYLEQQFCLLRGEHGGPKVRNWALTLCPTSTHTPEMASALHLSHPA